MRIIDVAIAALRVKLGDVSRHGRPMRPSTWTRRAFLGGAAVRGAGRRRRWREAQRIAECRRDGREQADRGPDNAEGSRPRWSIKSENSLPGYPDWRIKNQGPLHAIGGYTGQASVRPGEPIDLYVSTTSREFSVKAFRMGWYNHDLARLVWQSGADPRAPAGADPVR